MLGQEVRFDGGHKRDPVLSDLLSQHIDWVPVCPEVEVGMGTPREPVNLFVVGAGVRMIAADTGRDYTGAMMEWARGRVRELAGLALCGYVLKKNSPSCGLDAVKVHFPSGTSERTGRGLFARVLLEEMPWLPAEEEDTLANPDVLDSFLERAVALRRLHDLSARGLTARTLIQFHSAHKMSLLARSRVAYESLGRLVAAAGNQDASHLHETYRRQFMDAMRNAPTRGRHADVLSHMAGHFKDRLDRNAAGQLSSAIESYRRGEIARAVPLSLVRSHAERLGIEYVAGQTYLEPPLLGVRLGSDPAI